MVNDYSEYMYTIECSIHKEKFALPTNDEEFLAGRLHADIEKLCEHKEQHRVCKFVEVKA